MMTNVNARQKCVKIEINEINVGTALFNMLLFIGFWMFTILGDL